MMSKNYETIELDVTPAQKMIIDIVMNEGALRERERILSVLEEEFWEVDPDIRARILDPQHYGTHWVCCDCGAEYPPEVSSCERYLNDYLAVGGFSSVEEAIMGAAQKVIDSFETTYDKRDGQWVVIEGMYRYQTPRGKAMTVVPPGTLSFNGGY